MVVVFIGNMPKTFRFNTSGTTELQKNLWGRFNNVPKKLTDGQLVALTLNEICAHDGRGEVLWTPTEFLNVALCSIGDSSNY